MNRYNLKSTEATQAAAKEREFKTAWYTVAKVHKIIDDTIPTEERKILNLALNMDEFKLHGSRSAFYGGHHDPNHFYVQLTFGYTEVNDRDNPKHSVTLNISAILSSTKEALKNEILRQVQASRVKYASEHYDPDIERQLGKMIPRSIARNTLFGQMRNKQAARNKEAAASMLADLQEEGDWLD